MNETTQNFLDVWNNLEPWSLPVIFWRLYYDDKGLPLFYTQEDKPGNYIDVTPDEYRRASMAVKVVSGKLVEVVSNPVTKKIPADTGHPCHINDVSIIVPSNAEHQCWRIETYEAN